MKKYIISSFMLVLLGAYVVPLSFAQTTTPISTTPTLKNLREAIQEERRDIREDRSTIKTQLQSFKNKSAHVTGATVTAVNASSITVTKDSKTYTINVTTNTKLRRHFWGSSTLSEISVNNLVNIWGKWSDDAQTTIDATLIRDLSIMKRRGVFFGQVTSVTTNGFVLQSKNRGDQTITLSSTTKLINRKQVTITNSDIKNGDTVRVRGMWDKTNNTITEVTEVKDFSLPSTTPVPTHQ